MHPTVASLDLQGAFGLNPFGPPDPEIVDDEREERAHRMLVARFGKAAPPLPLKPKVLAPDRAFGALEDHTREFRHALARRHRSEVADSIGAYRDALSVWDPFDADLAPPTTTSVLADFGADCLTRAAWHKHRAGGQTTRFARVRLCGARIVVASCKGCGDERKPMPEGCGVTRVCPRCALQGAKERRMRFGRARGTVLYKAMRAGLTRKNRHGGRYTEKMLTLTVPHVTRAECTGFVGKHARDDTHARILALFKAWPIFLRFMNRAWRARGEDGFVKHHRAFEWTPGGDRIGHPHFHVYLWSPFIPASGRDNLVRSWWAHALRKVGVPVKVDRDGRDVVVTELRMVRDFNAHMVEELIKGGRREAIALSRLDVFGPGGTDVYDYADGWTIGDVHDFCAADVVARLYMALEGRRLAQASRGFFGDDPPLECACCGSPFFRVRFEARVDRDVSKPEADERGPP